MDLTGMNESVNLTYLWAPDKIFTLLTRGTKFIGPLIPQAANYIACISHFHCPSNFNEPPLYEADSILPGLYYFSLPKLVSISADCVATRVGKFEIRSNIQEECNEFPVIPAASAIIRASNTILMIEQNAIMAHAISDTFSYLLLNFV